MSECDVPNVDGLWKGFSARLTYDQREESKQIPFQVETGTVFSKSCRWITITALYLVLTLTLSLLVERLEIRMRRSAG